MVDILRDRRSLVVSIFLPLILFPLSFGIVNINNQKAKSFSKEKPLVVVRNCDAVFVKFIKNKNYFVISESSLPADELLKNNTLAVIEFSKNHAAIEVTIDSTRKRGLEVYAAIEQLVTQYNQIPLSNNPNNMFYRTEMKTMQKKSVEEGRLILSMLLPILLFVFSLTAPMPIAGDLFAGEKERMTFEHLLCAPITRASLLIGKISAIVTMGTIGVSSFFSGIVLSYYLSPDIFGVNNVAFILPRSSIAGIVFVTMILIMIFASIESVISLFARSVKESQLFFVPVAVIAIGCGHSSTILDISQFSFLYRIIPLVNISILIKEFSLGYCNFLWLFLAFGESLLVITIALFLSHRLLNNEKSIFRN